MSISKNKKQFKLMENIPKNNIDNLDKIIHINEEDNENNIIISQTSTLPQTPKPILPPTLMNILPRPILPPAPKPILPPTPINIIPRPILQQIPIPINIPPSLIIPQTQSNKLPKPITSINEYPIDTLTEQKTKLPANNSYKPVLLTNKYSINITAIPTPQISLINNIIKKTTLSNQKINMKNNKLKLRKKIKNNKSSNLSKRLKFVNKKISNLANKRQNKSIIKRGAKLANKRVSKPVAKPVAKLVDEPVDESESDSEYINIIKTGSKTVAKSVAKTVAKPVAKPAIKTVAKPAIKTVTKPESKPESKPVAKPVAKPVVKIAAKPIIKPVTKLVDESVHESGDESEKIKVVKTVAKTVAKISNRLKQKLVPKKRTNFKPQVVVKSNNLLNIKINNSIEIPEDYDLIMNEDTTYLKHKRIAVIIRGHIRESFQTQILYNFLKKLKSLYYIDLYLHTWHKSEARISWRKLSPNMFDINQELIKKYLKDINFNKLIIDNDYNIDIVGNKEGKVGMMPLIGWKRMWYGKYQIINYVNNQNIEYDATLNFRWDNFICQSSKKIITDNAILYNIKKYLLMTDPTNKIYFIKDSLFYGIDNYYIGKIKQIYALAHKFNFDLDNLMRNYLQYSNQEFLVYLESVKYFQK